MKKTCLTLIAAVAAATAVAGPVLAQPYGPPRVERPGGWGIERRVQWTQERIVRGRDSGALDRREFDRVQGELNGIRREFQYDRERGGGQLDDRARADLEARLDHLNDQIHWLRELGDRRPW